MAKREIYQLSNKPNPDKTDLIPISDESDNHKSKNILIDALIQLLINDSLKKVVFLENNYTVQPTDNQVIFSCQTGLTIRALSWTNYPSGFSFTLKHDDNDATTTVIFIPDDDSQVDYFRNLALSKNQGVTLTLEPNLQNWMSSACAGGGQDYWPYNNANLDNYTLKISDNKNFIAFPPTSTAKKLTIPSNAVANIRQSFLCFVYCPPLSKEVTITSTDIIQGVTTIPPGQVVMIYKLFYGGRNVWVVAPLGFDARVDTIFSLLDIRTGQIGINGTPDPFALIDMQSTTKAPIFPRMTQAQRDVIIPKNGMLIYNTTIQQFNFYENGAWKAGNFL